MVRSAEETRDSILNAAGELFAEKGYTATTVRDICGAAGVNLQAIGYHFGDKSKLYVACLRRGMELSHQDVLIPNLSPDLPPAEQFRQVLDGLYAPILRRDPERVPVWCMALMLKEMTLPAPTAPELLEEFIRPKHAVLAAALRALVPEADDQTIQLTALSVVGQVLFHCLHRSSIPIVLGQPTMDLGVSTIIEHIYKFTLAALTNPMFLTRPPAVAHWNA